MDDLGDLLNQRDYAKVRKCSERTIERERATGTGCRYVKIGRAVRYRRRDIFDFIDRHVRQSTSERTPLTTAEVGPALDVRREGQAYPGDHRDAEGVLQHLIASDDGLFDLSPQSWRVKTPGDDQ